MAQQRTEAASARRGVHSFGAAEELADDLEHLTVGRMIERLDADDFLRDLRVVLLEMMQQLRPGGAGADDEDFVGVLHRVGDAVEIMLILRGAAGVAETRLVVQVNVAVVGVELPLRRRLSLDGIDLGLLVIDPDGYVVHGNSPCGPTLAAPDVWREGWPAR